MLLFSKDHKSLLVFILLSISLGTKSFAQDSLKTSNYKTLGVVLSGGGAKGMAHIGLLKTIDSLGLKVNYIGGTSMGSIVGSLYACGYSAKEIEYRMKTMNWNDLFDDQLPLNEINIEEKNDYGRFLFDIPFKKGKVDLPTGLIKGAKLYNEFVKLTFPTITTKEFDSLPIKLRLNAVNLETGKNYVFKNEYLPSAMRASMSIPSAFYPVELDSGYFVDGGVMRNTLLPEIKELKPDFTIVSFTGNMLTTKKELNSITKIMGQVFFLSGSRDIEENIKNADLFIQPELTSGQGSSFNKSAEIIQAGIAATKIKEEELVKIFSDPAFKRNDIEKKWHSDEEILNEEFEIDSIYFQNLKKNEQKYFLSQVNLQNKELINLKHLFKSIQKGYATLRYEYIYYELEFKGYRPDGKKKIAIKFKIIEASTSNLRFGFHADSDLGAGFLVNFIKRDLIFKRSRFVFEVDLSKNYRGKLVYQVPFGKRFRSIIGAMTQVEAEELKDFQKKSQTDLYQMNISKGYLWYQFKFTKNLAFNTGYEFEALSLTPKFTNDTLFNGNKRVGLTSQNILNILEYNSIDRAILPRKGTKFQLRFRYIYYAYKLAVSSNSNIINTDISNFEKYDPYLKLYAFGDSYLKINNRNSIVINYDFNVLFSDKDNEFDNFYLGSIGRGRSRTTTLFGYRNGELDARNFASLNLGYQVDVYKEFYLKASIGGCVYNHGSDENFFNSLSNITSSATLKTSGFGITGSYIIPRIGPISVTYHKSFDRRYSLLYFSLGYKFQLL